MFVGEQTEQRGRPVERGSDRAIAPVTGKILEVSLVVIYLGLLGTTLYGGVVPGYQSAAGSEVAERTLATASQRIQQAVPPNGTHVRATARVELPDTIAGRMYEVRVDGQRLVLDHPDRDVVASSQLALPGSVVDVSGSWSSTEPAHVRVRGTANGLIVALEEGQP